MGLSHPYSNETLRKKLILKNYHSANFFYKLYLLHNHILPNTNNDPQPHFVGYKKPIKL
jgi:hypothetical protein